MNLAGGVSSPAVVSDPIAGILAGVVAGLAAALAMNYAQKLVPLKPPGNVDPATVRTAKALTKSVAGKPLAQKQKRDAGNFVHYAFGALVGGIYGAAAERWPRISRGLGIPFGLAVSLVADEALVPALGLSLPPWKSPAKLHAYGAVSHIVFGAVAETTRKIIRRLF